MRFSRRLKRKMLCEDYESDCDTEPAAEAQEASTNGGTVRGREEEACGSEPVQKKARPSVEQSPEPVAKPSLPPVTFDEPSKQSDTSLETKKPVEKKPYALVPPQIWKKIPNEKSVDF